jgi:uncharacterized membrane protein
MAAGKIISGVILIIIGVIIYGLVNNYQAQCQSFLGNVGQSFSSDYEQRCTIVNFGMILAAILAVIGIVLVIVGAVSTKTRTPKEYAQPKQQYGNHSRRQNSEHNIRHWKMET